MREIVLDTETTGLDPAEGHRIVEVACVELMNHVPTGRVLHHYVNPERDMPADAFAVHGLSAEFLAGYPLFSAVAAEVVGFIGGGPLVIHNAEFDLKFLQAELRRAGLSRLDCTHVDTLLLARRRFPGSPASLDALCRRFLIDLSERGRHGARLDCELLARVYLELIGGRQPGLDFIAATGAAAAAAQVDRPQREARPHVPTAAETAAHEAFLKKLKSPLWLAAD